MLKSVLEHRNVPLHSVGSKINDTGEKVDSRKFSMTSLTHQFSFDEGNIDEPDDDFTKLIEKSSYDPGVFSAPPSRKVSKMSNSGLTYIQEEEGSIERTESLDFESYSGDSNI